MDSRMSSVEDGNSPRVKFLCSFGGSILPRPQDGKLRYVGGDTRIVSLPRHFGYEELLVRMREVFEGVAVVKYQQSDEDLDALVSVFNDDDVVNMMEEYLKLGLGDGVARLRIFLFTQLDCNDLVWFDDDDKEESQRKYLDALNSIKSNAGGRKQSLVGSPVLGSAEGVRVSGGVLLNLGSTEKQSNCELNFLRQNLNLLTIPHMDTGHSQHFLSQSYSEMEAPWSPAYCSPGHQVHQDIRPMAEFPISPSSGFYHVQSRGFSDKLSDPMRERQPAIQQHSVVDKVGRLSPGSTHVDMNGSPPILTLAPGAYKGMDNSVHGLCQMTSHRNQISSDAVCNPDFFWKHGEQPNGGRRHKKLDHGVCSKEQNETQTLCSEAQVHETGVGLHQHLHLLGEAPIVPVSGAGMVNEHNVSHATSMTSTPFALGNYGNGHHSFTNHNNHEDPGYVRPAPELVNEGFHGQTTGATPHILISPNKDLGVRYGNHHALAYGTDNAYRVSNGPTPAHSTWRTAQNGFHDHPSYEPSISLPQVNGVVNSGNLRGVTEDSPSLGISANNKNYLLDPSKKVLPHDISAAQMYHMGYAPKLILHNLGQGYQYPMPSDSNQPRPDLIDFATPMELVLPFISSSSVMNDKMSASTYNPETVYGTATGPVILDAKNVASVANSNVMAVTSYPEKHMEVSKKVKEEGVNSNGFQLTEGKCDTEKKSEIDSNALSEPEGLSAKSLSFLPDLIASVKRVALEGAENVRVQGNADGCMDQSTKEDTSNEFESVKAHVECEVGSDGGHANISKIEPTKAEAEALARGLQTIRNDDLEEIRLLGSGAYGAVYHGKWKGSDVAIKRIRASCFAGRPSERERLIADFWKEALILSSLHHPNVVSFYGIVRDGPDGSLATLTEFMINGSLKQFLQKKDRTIDRRKRLIIAMDAAFGMEYLHEKNIVHFDLKCENLLVNMRDPHRPVCKIGDMGLSKVKQHTLVSGGVRGTLPWMAPELMNGQSTMVTEKIDVYSFGIVMWELLTGEEPYSDMHCVAIIGGIVSNTLRPQVPAWCDPEWKSLMESCWASDAAERPSFSEISQKLRKMKKKDPIRRTLFHKYRLIVVLHIRLAEITGNFYDALYGSSTLDSDTLRKCMERRAMRLHHNVLINFECSLGALVDFPCVCATELVRLDVISEVE